MPKPSYAAIAKQLETFKADNAALKDRIENYVHRCSANNTEIAKLTAAVNRKDHEVRQEQHNSANIQSKYEAEIRGMLRVIEAQAAVNNDY